MDIPEEQKEPALKIASVLSTKSWERAKELGMSWEEFQNDLLNKVLIVGDNKPLISNTLGLSNIKDLSAEEEDIIDMMRDRGATDDFIYQAIISKRNGTPLFSQVEMQLENDKLDANNPAYEGETININGADKTVYNSDGTKIAKSAEALQNFYNWFGDSKAVNERGEPIVLFHGTGFDFNIFRKAEKGIFLSDNKDVAQFFAVYSVGKPENRSIKAVYAKIENPLVVDAKGAKYGDIEINGERLGTEDISKNAQKQGYDGVIINNVLEAGAYEIEGNDYIVFESNQIKATGNVGTFSSENNDILYSKENFDPETYFEQPDVKENIRKSSRAFSDALDDFEWGRLESGRTATVLFKPTKVWTMVGLPNRRISLSQSKIRNIMKKHGLTLDDLRTLPEKLANPEYIFESATDDVAFVGVLDKNKQPFVAAVKTVGEGLAITNIVKSTYNKYEGFVEEQISKGRLLYDKKNPTEFRPHRALIAQGFPQSDNTTINQNNSNVNNELDSKSNDTKVLGSYQRNSSLGRLITLSKTPNKDTFLHEMSHALWEQYYDLTDKLSLKRPDVLKEVKPLLDYTGKKNLFELMQDADAREKVNEVFLRYLNTNEAPSEAMRPVFGRVKNWAISLYKTIATDNAVSPEIKEYFDKMLSEESDISNMREVQDNLSNIVPILTKIKKGEEATISGKTRQDIQSLLKALHARKPRKAKTLAQTIREMGGVKEGSLLAKQLPQDSQMIKKNGVFSEPEDLGDTLKRLGFYVNTNYENDEQHTQMNEDIVNILNKAETQYSDSEKTQQALVDNYDENIKYAQDALAEIQQKEGLNNLSEVEDLLNKALVLLTPKGKDNVLVNKDVIQYIKSSMFDAKKRVAKMQKQANEERYDYQAQLTNFIRSLPISYKNKDKLIGNIRRVTDEESFKKVLEQVQKQAEKYAEYEQKKLYKDSINNILKTSRPKKITKQQSHNYEDNTFWAEMRKINAMNSEQALNEMQKILHDDKHVSGTDLFVNDYDILKLQMLSYKVHGNDTSLAVLQNLSDGLAIAYKNMIDTEVEYNEKMGAKRKALRDKLIEKLKENAENPTIARKVVNKMVSFNGDFYTLMNEMFGKEVADSFDMRALEGKQLAEIGNRTSAIEQKAMKIYGIDSEWDWLDKKGELSKPAYHLTAMREGSNFSQDISKADIMDIYLGMKNSETRELFIREFEEFGSNGMQLTNNLTHLINNVLDEKDRAVADLLQEDIIAHSEAENAAFVRRYGIDMPKVDNYWMRSSASENSADTEMENYKSIALKAPSFFQKRSPYARPRPMNVFQKYQNHLENSTYAIMMYDKYKEIYLALKNPEVRDAIRSIKLYKGLLGNRLSTLDTMLDDMSMQKVSGRHDDFTKFYNKVAGNIVGAQVKFSLSVFLKQLVSVTNYAVGMQKKDYIKGVSYAMQHPKEAYDYVNNLTDGFIEAREKNGHLNQLYAAQIERAKNGETGANSGKLAFIDNLLSMNVRKGDILPIVWGGYAKAKYLESQGKSKEEIRDIIIKETLESQQSSTASSTSNFQKNALGRLFSFKNTAYQYSRILQNAYLQYTRGEIDKKEFAERYLNYGVIQPVLYLLVGDLMRSFYGLFKDDKKKKKEENRVMGYIQEMMLQPFAGVPILKDSIDYITNNNSWAFSPIVPISKMNESYNALKKIGNGKHTAKNYNEFLVPIVEAITGEPLGQIERNVGFVYNAIDNL